MACPNYRINPNYTPGSNYPQYEYTDIASTAQLDPYAAPPPQPQHSFASAPSVTPYHNNNDTHQVPGPPVGPQHHFIADLPPNILSTTASPPTNQQQQRHDEEPQVHPVSSPPTKKPIDAIVAAQERALREIVA
jgi:hypothetical protein